MQGVVERPHAYSPCVGIRHQSPCTVEGAVHIQMTPMGWDVGAHLSLVSKKMLTWIKTLIFFSLLGFY